MPTMSENLSSYIPTQRSIFQNSNTIAPISSVQPMTLEQFRPFNVQPPPGTKSAVTPREIKTSLNDLEQIGSKKRRRLGFWVAAPVGLTALAIIGAAIAVPLVLIRRTTGTTNTTLATTILSTVASSATSSITTIATTTANCVSPYAVSSSGTCVNILTDVNNCGAVSHVCGSNYTSCSAGTCSSAPGVQLLNANFIWTAAINGSVDDAYYPVTIPFNITLYNTTVNLVYVTTNGVLCLGGCSSAYTETNLPGVPFAGPTALPYWDDLYIYSGTSQGIYYAANGNAPNRTLTFEFYTSHFNQASQYYHFQVIFFESAPGVVQYKYYDASDGGVSCTVGIQASSSGPFVQYSFDLPNSVHSNMSLTFDSNTGTYYNSTF